MNSAINKKMELHYTCRTNNYHKEHFMKIRKHLLFNLLFLVLLFVQTSCQSNNYLSFKNSEALQEYLRWEPGKAPIISAHRGGPMSGFPENCLETFENGLKYAPVLIECDVAKTKDSILVMMHDNSLDRTTTGTGKIGNYTLEELKALFLKDNDRNVTNYKIPTLAEVLDWARNKAIVELDIKRSIAAEEITKIIEENNAESYALVITYNLPDAQKYHQLNPNIVISASAKGVEGTQRLLDSGINPRCLVAFTGVYESEKDVYDMLHANGIMAILGTMGNLDRKAEKQGLEVYKKLVQNGADILATDNVELASKILSD